MGLFDFFKSKKEAEEEAQARFNAQCGITPDPEPTPPLPLKDQTWLQRFSDYVSKNQAEREAVCEMLLNEIAPHLDSGKIKKFPDDDRMELRGRIDNLPLRIEILVFVGMGSIELEMKVENRLGQMFLVRDHDKIPMPRDEADDWAEEDDLRVFVAKGIYVEGMDDEVSEWTSNLQALPMDISKALLTGMEQVRVKNFIVDRPSISVSLQAGNNDLEDPVSSVIAGAELIRMLAPSLLTDDPNLDSDDEGGDEQTTEPIVRAKCPYCTTLFVLGRRHDCPNCGAPYTG